MRHIFTTIMVSLSADFSIRLDPVNFWSDWTQPTFIDQIGPSAESNPRLVKIKKWNATALPTLVSSWWKAYKKIGVLWYAFLLTKSVLWSAMWMNKVSVEKSLDLNTNFKFVLPRRLKKPNQTKTQIFSYGNPVTYIDRDPSFYY